MNYFVFKLQKHLDFFSIQIFFNEGCLKVVVFLVKYYWLGEQIHQRIQAYKNNLLVLEGASQRMMSVQVIE